MKNHDYHIGFSKQNCVKVPGTTRCSENVSSLSSEARGTERAESCMTLLLLIKAHQNSGFMLAQMVGLTAVDCA